MERSRYGVGGWKDSDFEGDGGVCGGIEWIEGGRLGEGNDGSMRGGRDVLKDDGGRRYGCMERWVDGWRDGWNERWIFMPGCMEECLEGEMWGERWSAG
jgi:hypothetical protein